MSRLNPDATFDSLFLASRLQAQQGAFATQEIHLLAYLACLLALYRQHAVTDWGYAFVGTELGAPFSQDIDAALHELQERSFITRLPERSVLTELAEQRLRELCRLEINRERSECLEGACSSLAAFSIGMVSTALANEPELSRSRAIPSSRFLLEDAARTQIYEQFDALRSALNHESGDLRLPAVVWLSALYRLNESLA